MALQTYPTVDQNGWAFMPHLKQSLAMGCPWKDVISNGNFLQLSHYLELLTAEATSPSLQGLNDTSLSQP